MRRDWGRAGPRSLCLMALSKGEGPRASGGGLKRGGLDLLCAKHLHRVGKYDIFGIFLFVCFF